MTNPYGDPHYSRDPYAPTPPPGRGGSSSPYGSAYGPPTPKLERCVFCELTDDLEGHDSSHPGVFYSGCVFCDRIIHRDWDIVLRDLGVCVFEPLHPVTPGHRLVVPLNHSTSAMMDPYGAGRAVQAAAFLIGRDGTEANIITSVGRAATQSVWHTHIHIVPRTEGDGLSLPWTGQQT